MSGKTFGGMMKSLRSRVLPTQSEEAGQGEVWSVRAISWPFIIANIPWATVLLTVFLAVIPAAVVNTIVKPRSRPFQIYDASISYPIRPDTVPPWASYAGPYLFYIISVLVGELILCRKSHGCWTNALSTSIYFLIDSTASFAVSNLVTEVSKRSVGFLRPYFLTACQPLPLAFPATPSIGSQPDPMCSVLDTLSTNDGRVSFPSGHSSASAAVSFYNVGYCVWLLYYRQTFTWQVQVSSWGGVFMRDLWRTLGVYWIMLMQAMAWAIALSRIIDFRHHPADVLGGHILGAIVATVWLLRAIATVKYQARYDPAAQKPIFSPTAPVAADGTIHVEGSAGPHLLSPLTL